MAFRDLLIGEEEVAEILNKGARDTNTFNALKYVQAIVEYKGLVGGIGDKMAITIPGLTELNAEEFEASVDASLIKDKREDIEEFLFGTRETKLSDKTTE